MTRKPRVLLVDVDDQRRETFHRYLSAQYDVRSFPLARRALDALVVMAPEAVLCHVHQPGWSGGGGLCASVRAALGDAACLTIVYGRVRRPRGGRCSDDAEGVDLRLDREVDEVDLDKALGHALAPRKDGRARATHPVGMSRRLHLVSAARSPIERSLWVRLRDRGRVVDRLPDRPDVSWSEILRARVTLHNLRVALGRRVTPVIDLLPAHRRPTWSEVLRARVSLHNLSVILGAGPVPGRDGDGLVGG